MNSIHNNNDDKNIHGDGWGGKITGQSLIINKTKKQNKNNWREKNKCMCIFIYVLLLPKHSEGI